jgi:hypothetical protein
MIYTLFCLNLDIKYMFYNGAVTAPVLPLVHGIATLISRVCVSKLFERLCPQDCCACRLESKLEVYLRMLLCVRHYVVTKLYSSPPPPNVVHRPRLIERLNESLPRASTVTLISILAGFGKTTLVS